jgi:hypothetical protein
MLGILEAELRYLSAGERGSLNEPLMFQLDKSLANQALSDPELLGNLAFDDLFTGLNGTGNNRFPERSHDAGLFRNRFYLLKS